MSTLTWPDDYVSADGSGLNTAALLSDFEASSGLSDLSPAELEIFDATLEATVWSYPLNETYRYYNLDTVVQAPANELFKPDFIASWLNENSAPAPNASLLYMTAWLDLSQGEQVLQLPANPDGNYYVFAILDSYINTNGSFGPRLQGNNPDPQYVLLAGPDSDYYRNIASGSNSTQTTVITDQAGNQTTMHVLQVDTPKAWITARIDTNSLDLDSMNATRDFINGTEGVPGSGFQLSTLSQFISHGTGSVQYSPPISQTATGDAADQARSAWLSVPTKASDFFTQVGEALALNPVPSKLDPSFTPQPYQIWTGNQNVLQNSATPYQPPSALGPDEVALLDRRFATIGLNLSTGFSQPSSWTAEEKVVFQKSYTFALELLDKATNAQVTGTQGVNNGWNITNDNIGVYPNTWRSWLVRAGTAIDGGAANIPNDAVYPTTQIDEDGHQLTSTYNYRIALPPTAGEPPLKTETYAPAQGFWSFTVYQPNPGNAYQPFLIENAISNTTYTPLNSTATLTADGRLRTTRPPDWNQGIGNRTAGQEGNGVALLTGSSSAVNGLQPNSIYYVYGAEEDGDDLLLQLASDYQPSYSSNGIPVGGEGLAGPALSLSGTTGSSLSFGWINPVAQLGSNQLSGETNASTTLVTESDGSINLTLSNLTPPANLENWLPTPLVTGAGSSNPQAASEFLLMARYYWPSSDTANGAKSVLADPTSSDVYAPPAVERLGLNRIQTWDLLTNQAEALVKTIDPTFGSTSPLDSPSPFSSDVVGALLDLRFLPDALDGQLATVNYSYSRNADYNNQLFFYAIDDVTGSINGLSPSDSNYLNEAWSRRLQPSAPIVADFDSTSTGSIQLTAGQLFAPIVNNGKGQMFTAFDSANASDYRHFDLLSGSSFAFEDLLNGGNEHDRNDGILTITSIDLSAP